MFSLDYFGILYHLHSVILDSKNSSILVGTKECLILFQVIYSLVSSLDALPIN